MKRIEFYKKELDSAKSIFGLKLIISRAEFDKLLDSWDVVELTQYCFTLLKKF